MVLETMEGGRRDFKPICECGHSSLLLLKGWGGVGLGRV